MPYRFVTGALDDVAAQALIASTVTDTATAREQIEAMMGGGGSVPVPAAVGLLLGDLAHLASLAAAFAAFVA